MMVCRVYEKKICVRLVLMMLVKLSDVGRMSISILMVVLSEVYV